MAENYLLFNIFLFFTLTFLFGLFDLFDILNKIYFRFKNFNVLYYKKTYNKFAHDQSLLLRR